MLTNTDFLRVGEEWPPPQEKDRLQKYNQNRQLWNNKHTEVYGDWWRVLREEFGVSHEIVFNFHKRLSTLWAFLVFGDPPSFVAGEAGSPEQDAIDNIVADSNFGGVGYEGVLDTSRYGDALFKVRLKDGKAIIQAQSPRFWYPVVSLDDQRDVQQHVIAWTFEAPVGPKGEERTFLRAEVHEKGSIRNLLFEVKGEVIHEQLDLDTFFPDRLEKEPTGIEDDFLIQHVPGLRASDEFYGKDDYGDIDSFILEWNGRASQLSRVQDRHSDPTPYGPEDLLTRNPLTGAYEFDPGKYYGIPPGEQPPGYLTWDASQQQQFEFMNRLEQGLYVVSETTPSAFGHSETGYAESGTSLRLRMVPPLGKAGQIRNRYDPVVERTLLLAARLADAWGVLEEGAVPESINASWNDGLPRDPNEEVDREVARIGAGLTSRYSALRRLDGGTDEEIEEELERIDEDRNRAAATTMRQPATEEGEPVEGEGDAASRAEALLQRMRGTSTNGRASEASAGATEPNSGT